MNSNQSWNDLLKAYASRDWDSVVRIAPQLHAYLDAGGSAPNTHGSPEKIDEIWNWGVARFACHFALTQAADHDHQNAQNLLRKIETIDNTASFDTLEKNLGPAIKILRQERRVSQDGLALAVSELTGVRIDQTAFSRIEANERQILGYELIAICIILKCDMKGLVQITRHMSDFAFNVRSVL